MDYEAMILARQDLRDELLEYCDGECNQCPFAETVPRDRGWSRSEFFKEDVYRCTLKGED